MDPNTKDRLSKERTNGEIIRLRTDELIYPWKEIRHIILEGNIVMILG